MEKGGSSIRNRLVRAWRWNAFQRGAKIAPVMAADAEEFAQVDVRLDFTKASLEVLDAAFGARTFEGRINQAGAYIGEVLIRNIASLRWALADPIDHPVVAVSREWTDPFDVAARRASPQRHPDDTLTYYFELIAQVAQNPSEERMAALGLRPVYVEEHQSAWNVLVADFKRWRWFRRRLSHHRQTAAGGRA